MRPSRKRLRAAVARFAKERSGAAAVEMALIAAPFFYTLMALAEVALMSMVQSNLDFAMSETARRIRTGEVQTQNLSAAQIRQEVCAGVRRIMALDCEGNLFIDVDRFDAFVDVASPNPADDGALDEDEFAFNPGAPSDIVLARGFYRWKVLTPLFGEIFGNIGGGERLITSAILFRNEPFPEPDA